MGGHAFKTRFDNSENSGHVTASRNSSLSIASIIMFVIVQSCTQMIQQQQEIKNYEELAENFQGAGAFKKHL